jgi:hypothetical protein
MDEFIAPDKASSRASPLPQGNAVHCGSGFAREEAVTANINVTAENKNAAPTKGRSGRGTSLKRSVHEQSDQDDDRDWYAEKEQQ